MKLTNKAIKRIDDEYGKLERESEYKFFTHGLYPADGVHGTCIYSNVLGTYICKVDELQSLIEELQMMKQAIENATGIIIESTNH